METPDARTVLNIVSNCYTELRIFAYEHCPSQWTHSLYLEGPSPDAKFEGSLSPSLLIREEDQRTLQVALTLSWTAQDWTVEAEIGRSDEREDYEVVWSLPPAQYTELDAALRAFTAATGQLIEAARPLYAPAPDR